MSDLKKAEVIGTLIAAWKRQLVSHAETNGMEMFAVYKDEALMAWLGLIVKPWIGSFNNNKCVLIPIASWIHLKQHAAETVTPFIIVLKGKTLVHMTWNGISGLKYAIRNTKHGACLHIPLTVFKPVK